jgi:mannosyltransferase OCH1-like enzyme
LGVGHRVNNPIFVMKLKPKSQNGNQKIIKTLAREFGFGTWNVRAVLTPESIKELILQIKQYSIHVMAIQDTR